MVSQEERRTVEGLICICVVVHVDLTHCCCRGVTST